MPKVILRVAAALFASFGLLLAIWPDALGDYLGISAENGEARTELRAFYGGLELGLAAFLGACSCRAEWLVPGCVALAMTTGAIAVVRALGMIADHSAGGIMFSFLAVEIILCALGVAAGLRAQAQQRQLSNTL